MKYYLVPKLLAEQLQITEYRQGGADGYVATVGDLAACGIEKAIASGAREITEKEATKYIKSLK